MPLAAKNCIEPGCLNPAATPHPRCAAHHKPPSGDHAESGGKRYGRRHQRLARLTIRRQPWCTYCGLTLQQALVQGIQMTADHVVSKADGGSDTADNYVTACAPCNSRKGKRSGTDWQRSGGDSGGYHR